MISDAEDLLNLIHREIMATMDRMTRRQPVKVDSYDPQAHSVKLQLLPESEADDTPVITGWVPLHPQQTGNGAGWHMPPNIGDHGWLEFHEFDREGGTFQQAVFNDKFPPDKTVQAGEWKYIHPKTQTQIYFKDDGSITIRGQNTSNANGGNNGNGSPPAAGGSDNSKQTLIFGSDGSITAQDAKGNKVVLNGTDTITATDAAGDTIVMKGGDVKVTDENGDYYELNGGVATVHATGSIVADCQGSIKLGSASAVIPVMLQTGPSTHIFGDH